MEQTVIFRQVERSVSGILAYPFNVAQRLELSGGLTNISFDQRVQTTTYDLATGGVLADDRRPCRAPAR